MGSHDEYDPSFSVYRLSLGRRLRLILEKKWELDCTVESLRGDIGDYQGWIDNVDKQRQIHDEHPDAFHDGYNYDFDADTASTEGALDRATHELHEAKARLDAFESLYGEELRALLTLADTLSINCWDDEFVLADADEDGTDVDYEGWPQDEEQDDTDEHLYGHGALHRSDGTIWYKGDWKDPDDFWHGGPHGQGTKYFPDGSVAYQGQFKNGDYHGLGTMYHEDGTVEYQGEFEFGVRHGRGTVYRKRGPTTLGLIWYVGEWRQNDRHGQGTLYDHKGAVSYIGRFKCGEYHGQGTEYLNSTINYRGDYEDGKRHGQGTQYGNDGSVWYQGDFKNGRYDGLGTSFYKEGSKYVGEHKAGERHGQGTAYSKDGNILYQGEWCNGKPIPRK